jgi:NADPH2:quinone reductase
MKALRFDTYGPPSVLSIEDVKPPDLADDEVLIQVKATGVIRVDVGVVGGVFRSTLPKTPGRDYAGVVVRGSGWEGKEVWGSGAGFGVARDGAHAEFVSVPSSWLSEKPANLGMEEAATVGIPFLVSWASLVEAGGIKPGDVVLLTGANGSVGHAAAQISHWKKAIVIGADRVDSIAGADHTINVAKQDLVTEVLRLTNGVGVDLVLDAVGGSLFEPCLKCLRLGGKQVAIASVPNPRVGFNLVDFLHRKATLTGVDTLGMNGGYISSIFSQLRAGFESGNLQTADLNTFPFEKAIDVYTSVADHTAKGVQVLTFE